MSQRSVMNRTLATLALVTLAFAGGCSRGANPIGMISAGNLFGGGAAQGGGMAEQAGYAGAMMGGNRGNGAGSAAGSIAGQVGGQMVANHLQEKAQNRAGEAK